MCRTGWPPPNSTRETAAVAESVTTDVADEVCGGSILLTADAVGDAIVCWPPRLVLQQLRTDACFAHVWCIALQHAMLA